VLLLAPGCLGLAYQTRGLGQLRLPSSVRYEVKVQRAGLNRPVTKINNGFFVSNHECYGEHHGSSGQILKPRTRKELVRVCATVAREVEGSGDGADRVLGPGRQLPHFSSSLPRLHEHLNFKCSTQRVVVLCDNAQNTREKKTQSRTPNSAVAEKERLWLQGIPPTQLES
jgi:hypothetical protein